MRAAPRARLESVDLVRGLIMVVMAIDHVRDMMGPRLDPNDLAVTTAALFLTRLVTHLCAPGFVLLAGTGAFLSKKSPSELSRFLLSRGLWLVVVELTIMKVAWSFNFDPHLMGLQVIWAIGWSMVAMAVLVRLPRPAVGLFGVAMIALHNLFDGVAVGALLAGPQGHRVYAGTLRDWLISFAHVQNRPIVYPVVPWIGVMAVGFALGPLFRGEASRRRRTLALLGVSLCAAFLLLRALNGYGDPQPWSAQASPAFTAISFFNTAKYPPSLDYLLMTLGPIFLLLLAAESLRGKVARPLIVFGRVPFFFYVLHVYLIHGLALALGVGTGFPAADFLVAWPAFPRGFGVGLTAVYLAWALVVLALYPACRWFAQVKERRRDWWLGYL